MPENQHDDPERAAFFNQYTDQLCRIGIPTRDRIERLIIDLLHNEDHRPRSKKLRELSEFIRQKLREDIPLNWLLGNGLSETYNRARYRQAWDKYNEAIKPFEELIAAISEKIDFDQQVPENSAQHFKRELARFILTLILRRSSNPEREVEKINRIQVRVHIGDQRSQMAITIIDRYGQTSKIPHLEIPNKAGVIILSVQTGL